MIDEIDVDEDVNIMTANGSRKDDNDVGTDEIGDEDVNVMTDHGSRNDGEGVGTDETGDDEAVDVWQ